MTVLVGYVPKPEGVAALNAAIEQARWRGEDVYVVNGSRGDALVDRSFASPEDLADALAREAGGVEVVALYSESLGEPGSEADTYAGLVRTNATRIAEALALIEGELPRPGVEFTALLPYERGDLVNRIHQQGEISSMEHTGEGTLVSGRANEDLAGELAAYAV